jgi:hypothetical protein
MTSSPARTLFLALGLAGSLLAQAADNTVRTLSQEGVTFKLPAGWDWQSEIASNIALKKEIKLKDRTFTITADLVFSAEGFLEDTITGIEKKVASSKGDLKDLKVTRGEKFAGTTAVLVAFTRVRGEKQDEFEDERQWLFRRNNALYSWTEKADRAVASQASSAFSAARSAIKFTGKDASKAPRTWEDQAIKYNLPPDWEYDKVTPTTDPKLISPIMVVETAVTLKGQGWRVSAQLFAFKGNKTLDDLEKSAKEEVTRDFSDVQDFTVVDKQTFNGEKSFMTSFVGRPVPKQQPAPEQPKLLRRDYFMKRKGYIIRWIETGPEGTNPAVEASLKKAREGLSWL